MITPARMFLRTKKKITLVGNNRGETWWSRSELVLPSETPREKGKVSELPQSNSSAHRDPLNSLSKERREMCFWFQLNFPNFICLLCSHLGFKSVHLPGRFQGCYLQECVVSASGLSTGLGGGFTSAHCPAAFSKKNCTFQIKFKDRLTFRVSKNSGEGCRASKGKQESKERRGAFHTGSLEGLKSQIVRILSRCLLVPNILPHTFPRFTSFLMQKSQLNTSF